MAKFKTAYGYFSDDGKEYVITRPDTPRPWINIISNSDYSLTISQTGSGYSWWRNSNLCRITRWEPDLISDGWGKYVYIRDRHDGHFWSLGYKPVGTKFKKYEVRHGLGYSVITSKYRGILASKTIFVARDEPLEIWKIVLRNESNSPKRLSLFSYFEWCLGNGMDTHREFQKTFIETQYDAKLFTIFGKKRPHLVPSFIGTGLLEWPIGAFHSSNLRPVSFEGDKENFLGMYRGLSNPLAVEKGRLSNTVGDGNDSVASLQADVDIKPGQEKVIVFLLGVAKDKKSASKLIKKYQDIKEVDNALRKVKEFWSGFVSAFEVKTPDRAFNFFTNIWLKYQAIHRIWARAAYYQQSGGVGFRDQLQDSHIFLPLKPELTRKQILLHAAHQFMDGAVYHWWHNLTESGAKTDMSDDLLWLPYLIISYLYETRDFSILKEKVKYVDGPKESVYKHCLRAIDRALSRFSKRGLPLIGEGDWNDGLSLVGVKGKGESIWLAHFLYGLLLKWTEAISKAGGKEFTSLKIKKKNLSYINRAKKIKQAINKYGWDGDWYIRATQDNGKLIGSARCKEGKIFLNAQTWSVINGTATEERAKKAIKSVEKTLNREYGPLLLYPAYTKPDANIGYITRYAPGARENGGVYSHAACWAVMAECILGKGDVAYDMYSKLCSIERGMDPKAYYAEPYVMSGNTDGPQSENFGRGGWTWYTGSAAWLFKTSTDWILGIRPSWEGLVINPCIPVKWRYIKVKRLFRGATYSIIILNPSGISKGIKEIRVDGRRFNSTVIPAFNDNKEHKIKVVMGDKSKR